MANFERTNQTIGKPEGYPPDPATLYKRGEQPRKIHRIDVPGWIANGWSEEELIDPDQDQDPEEQESQPKRNYKSRKSS